MPGITLPDRRAARSRGAEPAGNASAETGRTGAAPRCARSRRPSSTHRCAVSIFRLDWPLHGRPERRRVRVRTRSASTSAKSGSSAGPGTSSRRGGAWSRRPLSYPVRSPALRPARDPCPIGHGRDVPHGGALSMRRRVSAQLAFGHTPARPFSKEGRAFLHPAARTAAGATAPAPEPPGSGSGERRSVRYDAGRRVPPQRHQQLAGEGDDEHPPHPTH